MPNNKIVVETDNDQKTAYEDTTAHERPGFILDDDMEQLGKENKKQSGDLSNS